MSFLVVEEAHLTQHLIFTVLERINFFDSLDVFLAELSQGHTEVVSDDFLLRLGNFFERI